MTPGIKPAKMQATKTQDGRIHVAMGLGPKTLAIQKPRVTITWGLIECESSLLPGQSYEQYLDVLYSKEEAR